MPPLTVCSPCGCRPGTSAVPVERVMEALVPFVLHVLLEAPPPPPRAAFPAALHARLIDAAV
jgi:hypothetical protein